MPLLHCLACDTYFDHGGNCPGCGAGNWFTDEDVDLALEGVPVECASCGHPYIPDHLRVPDAEMSLAGNLRPGLGVRLGTPEEECFVKAARGALSKSDRELLGVYHASTTYRLRAAMDHLARLWANGVPLDVPAYNYEPERGEDRVESDEHELAFDTRIFDYLMNARSAADLLAHEVNVVLRAVIPDPAERLPDPTNPDKEKTIDFVRMAEQVARVDDDLPISKLLSLIAEKPWFRRLHDLRKVSFHRRVMVGRRKGYFRIRELRRIRPMKVDPVRTEARLPENPADHWSVYRYDQSPEIRDDLATIQNGLEELVDLVYDRLTELLNSVGAES